MTHETIAEAKQNAKRFGKSEDAYLRGFDRGYNCASWQDLPEIGDSIWTDSDGRVTVDDDNMWDVVQSLAYTAELGDRDFSPFEFTAAEFNRADGEEDSEELWEAFEEGISDGIHSNISERAKAFGNS